MTFVCGVQALTAGDIRLRAKNWFDWDEVRLICGEHCFPLELGCNCFKDYDWTDVTDFKLMLEEMGDKEPLRFRQNGKSIVVVGVEDEGEPFLVVEEVQL
jgi:hypothetical protein